MNKEVAGSCPIAMKAPETFNSLSELFLVSGIIINKAGHAVPMYFMIIVTYQCISWIISIGMNYLNKRVQLIDN